jgi:glutamate decarboxylase
MVHLAAIPNDEEIKGPDIAGLQQLKLDVLENEDSFTTTVYGSKYAVLDLPKYEMPENEMPKEVAYRMIKDDLSLDGNPTLNLASFVTTYMVRIWPKTRWKL